MMILANILKTSDGERRPQMQTLRSAWIKWKQPFIGGETVVQQAARNNKVSEQTKEALGVIPGTQKQQEPRKTGNSAVQVDITKNKDKVRM